MKKRIKLFRALFQTGSFLFVAESSLASENDASSETKQHVKRSLKDIIQSEDFEDDISIWESKSIEVYSAKIQILDKISGKVFRQELKTNEPIVLGSIKLTLKRCFKNSPEDDNEIWAFIEINEREKKIFSQWLLASSPSVSLLAHPVYDVRVEF